MKKFLIIVLLSLLTLGVDAQIVVMKVHFANADVTRDTVTSTATGYVGNLVSIGGPKQSTVIMARVTKVSGTVGGTLTIQGSFTTVSADFKAIVTNETQTAVATATAADGTAAYYWRLTGNPYPYYRVSYTGGSGAVAYLDGNIISH